MKGKTVIYSAHRLSSIINVDKIHVCKDGKVSESGTHTELMAETGSHYNLMWEDYLRQEKKKEKKAKILEEVMAE
jgi:ABC-type transport system involved in Fe-S cluster assembly fused permease/ATPase subunit